MWRKDTANRHVGEFVETVAAIAAKRRRTRLRAS
jgi:hypothetical protein